MRMLIGLLLLTAFSLHAKEGVLNRMLAPGQLMQGHAQLEGNCTACHTVGSGIDQAKCLECHKDIQKMVTAKQGFHGLHSDTCIKCHADHHGRLADTTALKLKTFDHSKETGFALTGKHASLKCAACHTEKRTDKATRQKDTHFFGAPTACVDCHKKDDPHQFPGKLGEKSCVECHSTKSWKKNIKFDHTIDAHYTLEGKHAQLKCSSCHESQGHLVYSWQHLDQLQCLACHANPHEGQFSVKKVATSCTACHTQQTWTKRLPFDHATTAFPLTGKHADLKCTSCHAPSGEKFASTNHSKTKFDFPNLATNGCVTCHNDVHKGQLGNQCTKCHTDTNWKATAFDHNKQSQFMLTGAHAQLKCASCHTAEGTVAKTPKTDVKFVHYKPIATTCATCHKDPHMGEMGQKCETCHSNTSWKTLTDFHKNYRLSGVHATLSCVQCHRDGQHMTGLGDNCLACHQKDDIHHGTLPKCGDCHRQQVWESPKFNHSMSRFPLRGAHRALNCNECHSNGIYKGLPNQCINCHLQDAQGSSTHPNPIPAFQNCTRCHNQFSFR